MRLGLIMILAAVLCAGCGGQPGASASPSSATPSPAPEASLSPSAAPASPLPSRAEPLQSAPAASESASGGLPLDVAWEWQASSYTDGSETVVGAPSSYTLRFLDGGVLEIRADCNGVGGSYTLSGETLELMLGPSTEVACASGSQADVFLRDLATVVSYTIEEGALTLALDADAGSMRFGAPGAAGALPQKELRGESTLDAALTAQLDVLLRQGVTPKITTPLGGRNLFPASPGAMLLLDTPDGSYHKAAGFARREDRTPMQPHDRFQIGSGTKLFVGVLLLQLEEDGVLSLDDPLARWLPDQAARIAGGDRITLRMLANHTSGLADYADNSVAIAGSGESQEQLERQYTPDELLEAALARPPLFAPGTPERWSYSNAGYILLGLVLEKAGGRPLGELLSARILEPLGMSDTLLPAGIPEPGSIVDGYRSFAGDNVSRWNTSQAWAAGAIESSMPDLLAFANALASGAVFQDPATLERMTDAVRSPDMAGTGWSGYGIGIADFGDGAWGHFGRTPGFESVVMFWPERATTLAGMANAAEGSVPAWQLLLERAIGEN